MAIELTDEEKRILRERERLKEAQGHFHQELQAKFRSNYGKKKFKKGRAQKRAAVSASMVVYSGPRSYKDKRIDAYSKQKRLEFYESDGWKMVRYQALKRSKGRCECCGQGPTEGNPLHVDHIKPRGKYPALALVVENLQVLCADCNHGKGSWDETDWRKAMPGLDKSPV